MDSAIWVAIISFIGTLLGTAGGIIASSKLVNYRLEQLERKVESLGNMTAKIPVMEEKIKNINRRIAKVEHIDVGDFCNVN